MHPRVEIQVCDLCCDLLGIKTEPKKLEAWKQVMFSEQGEKGFGLVWRVFSASLGLFVTEAPRLCQAHFL